MSARRSILAALWALSALVFSILSGGCCELTRGFVFPAPGHAREPLYGELVAIHAPSCDTVASFVRAYDGMPTVVHFHGNGQEIAELEPLAEMFGKRGVGFYAPEFPGYGLAEGSTNEASLYACADAAMRHLEDALHVPRARIVIEGQSIGTGVAVEMAARGFGSRMVLLSAYTSLPALLASKGVSPKMTCDALDSASKARAITQPVFLIHGTEDRLIPPSMSVELSRLFPHATLWLLDGAHHNDIFYGEGGVEIMDRIVAFSMH